MVETSIKNYTEIYKKLYNIGKYLNETFEIEELFNIVLEFATLDLNFEKAIIFKHDEKNGLFKIDASIGYKNPIEQKVLKIINLLLSGEVIEYLRISKKPIFHSNSQPNHIVAKLSKSLFLKEAYFELFGGNIDIPFGLIVVGNGSNSYNKSSIYDEIMSIALGNFIVQFSQTANNILFYKAWNDEKKYLEENIRKRTEELNAQKETFEAIYKTSKDGIGILDIKTTAFLDVNSGYSDITGFSIDEMLRTSCIKLTVENDRKQNQEAIKQVLEHGFITNLKKSCLKKDGSQIMTSMSIALMSDKKRMVVSVKDITELENARKTVELAHQNIKDSIKFASLIQNAILPDVSILFNKYLKDGFFLWQPRDSVGGDIYFAIELNDEVLIMIIDGAGHSVPGAFVTMLVKAVENQIGAELRNGSLLSSPTNILQYFNVAIKTMLKQDGRQRDFKPETGFDGGVLLFNRKTKKCRYSGAKTDLYILENNNINFLHGDRYSIGFGRTRYDQQFIEYEFEVSSGTKIYLATDGIFDQMNENREIFGKRKFENILLKIQDLDFNIQKQIILEESLIFRGKREQIDDITVLGLEFLIEN